MADHDGPVFRRALDHARALAGTLNPDAVLPLLIEAVGAVRHDAIAAVWLVDQSGCKYRLAAATSRSAVDVAPMLEYAEGLTRLVAEQRRPVVSDDVAPHAGSGRTGPRPSGYFGIPLAAEGRLIGVLGVCAPLGAPLTIADRDLIVLLAGHAAVGLRNARLFAVIRRRRRAAEVLAEVSRLLAQAVDAQTIAEIITENACPALDARSAAVYQLLPSGALGALAVAGVLAGHVDRKVVVPPGVGTIGLAVRARRTVVSANVLHDPRIVVTPAVRAVLQRTGHRAVLATPLVVKSTVIGALFVGAGPRYRFDRHDVQLAEAFAAHAAMAIDTAGLVADAERRQRDAEALADIARVTNGRLDLETVLHRIAACALTVCEAGISLVALRDPTDGMVTRFTIGASARSVGRHVAPGQGAGGQVIASGQPVWLTEEAADPAVHPDDVHRIDGDRGLGLGVVPIVIDDRIEGLVYVCRAAGPAWTERQKLLLVQLADHAAMAIRNSRLHDREHAALAVAESAREQLAVLADASAVLARSLDLEETLTTIARLSVPRLADWCTVDIRDENGSIRRLTAVHPDPSKMRLARILQGRYPLDPEATYGPAHVIRTGRSELYPAIPDTLLVHHAHDEEHLRQLRALGLRSAMVVPLAARGRVLGAMTFVRAESTEVYDAAALALAEDLGRRAALAIDNARLYHAAREADRHKEEFLLILAHELRTSLAPILAAARVMRLHPADAEAVGEAAEVVERRARHQARLLDDLLDITRVSRGKLELRKAVVSLQAVVQEALESILELLPERRHDLTVSLPAEPVPIEADSTRLVQVVVNLLTNAIKYTPPGGRIDVLGVREGDQVTLRIKDTGIGIPRDRLAEIFELFKQIDDRRQSSGGLGIGLTLVRRLVELHGGTVSAHSAGVGQGSEFVVRLPVEPMPATTLPAASVRPATPPRRVLVVEDDLDTGRMLRATLELDGHQVELASDGIQGLERAVTLRPDAALIDIGLPGMDGYDVARGIRDRLGDRILLIALTGHGQREARAAGIDAGFDAYLVKPVDFDQLARALDAAAGPPTAESPPV